MGTLDLKVKTLDSNMQSSQETHSQQINALNSKLDTLTATILLSFSLKTRTCRPTSLMYISDVECTDSEESLELYQNLQNSLSHQLVSISNKVDTVYAQYLCGGTGGWRRVVYLDMTDNSTTCPSGWQLTGYSKRTCGRVSTGYNTCDSATFPVSGGEYTRMCSRIKAYHWGHSYGMYFITMDKVSLRPPSTLPMSVA